MESFTEQDGDFDLDITGTPLAALFTNTTASYDLEYDLRWPRSVTAGGSYAFDHARISIEGAWFNWEQAFDSFKIKLANGGNPEFDAVVGPNPRDEFPLDWRDSYSARVGYEQFRGDTVLRLGYIFSQNPVPNRTLTPLLLGNLEHTFTVGLGHSPGPWEVNLAYYYSFGDRQRVGISDIIGGDFDNSNIQANAHWLLATLALNF